MSSLVLVRHGQARSFERDSDRLTELGEDQARYLAAWWLKNGYAFDEVYCGTLVRQRRTESIVGAFYDAAGRSWPGVQVTPDLNEYDAGGVLEKIVPPLRERDAQFAALAAAYEADRTNRNFQLMFERAMLAHFGAEIEVEGVEPWKRFLARVRGVLTRIQTGESNRRVAVFTSGGPTGVIVQTVLKAPERAVLDLNWRVKNCSLTEFVFSKDRISLDSFNGTPHLEPGLVTFR